jgi:FMN phosphatase YigB (HAD superfamily)
MKIFLDFDDSLFFTKKFRDELVKLFLTSGVSKKDFLRTYYDYPEKTKKGLKKYDPYRQVELLEKTAGADRKKILKNLKKLLGNSGRFVFQDVQVFLSGFKKSRLVIVSYGHTGFQEEKIRKCGLAKMVGRVVVTDKDKAEAIKRLVGKREKFVFIDDRIDQIEPMKGNFPKSVVFLLKRKEGRYNDFDNRKTKNVDFEVKNLKEAKKIIERIFLCAE